MGAVEIATAYVALVPTTAGIQSGIATAMAPTVAMAGKTGDDAGKKYGAGFGSSLKGAIGVTAGLAIGAKAISLIKDSVGEAREAQKVGAVTESIIKSTGGAANLTADQVGNLATALSNKTGVDDELIQSGANLLLTFKNVRDEAGKGNDVFSRATAAAGDLAASGFGSIESGSKMLGKALNDPVKGITALSRAGVTFTDQQKEQIAALVETGDVLGAQKIILAEVESQVGGTAAASATAGEKASVAWGNFKETIGTALLPVIDRFQAVATVVFGYLAENQGVVVAIAVGIGVLATALTIATIAQWAMNSALLASPVTWIILGVVALIAALVWLIANWDTVVAWLQGVWANVVAWLQGTWESILAGLTTAWNAVKAVTLSVWNFILGFFQGYIAVWRAIFEGIWSFFKTMFAWSPIGLIVTNWNAILDFFNGLPGRIKGLFSGAGEWLAEAGGRIIRGLIDGIKAGFENVKKTLSNLTDLLPDWKGPASRDARLLTGNGRLIMQSLVAGFEDEAPSVQRYLSGFTAELGGVAGTAAFDASAPRGGMFGDSVTLVDRDGSILARTRVIADGAVAGAQRAARGAAARRGLRTIAVGG